MKTKITLSIISCGIILASFVNAIVINYSYDTDGRLTKADYAANSSVLWFDYDSNGSLYQQKTSKGPEPQIVADTLIFPGKNSIIHASQLTNVTWNTEKIFDNIDGTNLTIIEINLHYADTTNFILEVTNNIANTLGEIEMYIPDGNWDGLTNYVLKFEVVDSSSLTNSRIFWDNEFIIVPEPFLFIIYYLGLWIIYSRRPLGPGFPLSL